MLNAIPVGIAYAIWAGGEIVLVALAGWTVYGQPPHAAGLAGIGLIVADIVILNLFSKTSAHQEKVAVVVSWPADEVQRSFTSRLSAGRPDMIDVRPPKLTKCPFVLCSEGAGMLMRRREFIATIGAAAWPLAVGAQQTGQMRRIGFLRAAPPPERELNAFISALAEQGYVQPRNFVMVPKWGDGNVARLPELAVALVNESVDVIVAEGTIVARAAAATTRNVPIVMVGVADPLAGGLVRNISRPGGNLTLQPGHRHSRKAFGHSEGDRSETCPDCNPGNAFDLELVRAYAGSGSTSSGRRAQLYRSAAT